MFIIQVRSRFSFGTVCCVHSESAVLEKLGISAEDFEEEFNIKIDELEPCHEYVNNHGDIRVVKMINSGGNWEI